MSDARQQIERVISDSDIPADITAEKPLEPDIPPDRTRQFAHTSFSRMRTGWRGEDREAILRLNALSDQFVRVRFSGAFSIMDRLNRMVRTQAVDSSGEYVTDPDGSPVWVKDEYGEPEEDWGRLTDRDRRDLLGRLVARLFEWERESVNAWSEAMVSKVQWEEVFSRGFTAMPGAQVSGKPTVDDRTQWGHRTSIEERYFAVFKSALSRRADAIIRSMRSLQYLLENMPSH